MGIGILAIIEMVATVAPKLISAGKSLYDVWHDAGKIISNAENNGGIVDEAAYAALVKKCQDADDMLQKRAQEHE